MENKSLKRGSVSKYRNVDAKRRRVTIVEKDISPNLYDQNIAIVENLMQKCLAKNFNVHFTDGHMEVY